MGVFEQALGGCETPFVEHLGSLHPIGVECGRAPGSDKQHSRGQNGETEVGVASSHGIDSFRFITRSPQEATMSIASRRFVILHHVGCERPHWDFLLEQEGALATWQL